MRLVLLFILIINTIFTISCTEKTSDTTDTIIHIFDPKIPGGQIINDSGSLAGKVLSLTADATQLNKITLNWQVPSMYKTMNYEVNIYKKKGNDPNFILPDPSNEYSSAYLYLRKTLVGETFIDQNYLNSDNEEVIEVEQNVTYTYWLYIKLNGDSPKWSNGVKIVVTSKTPEDTFSFPSVNTFWDNLLSEYGAPENNGLIALNTMSAGSSSLSNLTGGIASAYSGNVLYYADTANNRVVIYTRGLAYKCDDFKDTDIESYYACVYQYSGLPLSASGIIGQDYVSNSTFSMSRGRMTCSEYESVCNAKTSQSLCDPSVASNSSICDWVSDSNLPNGGTCTAMKKCLTSPSRVTVSDDRLFISDTGNNRIVVYYNPITAQNKTTLPVKGHVKDMGVGIIQEVDDGPEMVIGKKSMIDAQNYPIGKSSLNRPGKVTTLGNDLFIADSGNNRIVRIKDYKTNYICDGDDSWGNTPIDSGYSSGTCQFTSLLGQKNFFEKWSFKEGSGLYAPADPNYDGIKCTNPTPSTTYCDSPYILYNPSCSLFTTSGTCNSYSACNWIQTSPTTGTCNLRPEATLRNVFDTTNSNKPGQFMSRYFRNPTDIKFTKYKNAQNQEVTSLLVAADESASVTSPLGTSEVRGRILVWTESPFPENEPVIDPPPLDKCYAGYVYNNFEISTSKCHADFVIGQENFNNLSIVSAGSSYSNINYGITQLSGIDVRSKMLFAIDSINNNILFWENFTDSSLGQGRPANSKVANPNGRINSTTGRYLPTLKGISDIQVSPNNLIYISDPENNKVYEIRAYNYETAQ